MNWFKSQDAKSNKKQIDDIKQKVVKRQKEEKVVKETVELAQELPEVAYDIRRVDNKNEFQLVTLKYDPVTHKAAVHEVHDLNNKLIGIKFEKDKGQFPFIIERYTNK